MSSIDQLIESQLARQVDELELSREPVLEEPVVEIVESGIWMTLGTYHMKWKLPANRTRVRFHSESGFDLELLELIFSSDLYLSSPIVANEYMPIALLAAMMKFRGESYQESFETLSFVWPLNQSVFAGSLTLHLNAHRYRSRLAEVEIELETSEISGTDYPIFSGSWRSTLQIPVGCRYLFLVPNPRDSNAEIEETITPLLSFGVSRVPGSIGWKDVTESRVIPDDAIHPVVVGGVRVWLISMIEDLDRDGLIDRLTDHPVVIRPDSTFADIFNTFQLEIESDQRYNLFSFSYHRVAKE